MSSYPYPQTKPAGPEHEHRPCADCDLSGFDSVNCEIEGITAESDYMKLHKEKFATRRKQFDSARTAYDKARGEVAADLAQISQQLSRLRDQLECHLDEQTRQCLTEAWQDVAEQLRNCGGEQGCCVTEEQCRFEYDLGQEPKAPDIRALLEDFERRVVAAEGCFDKVLAAEPEELKKRIANLKTYIAAIAADPKTVDYSRAFAELLWAEHRRDKVWLGFDDVNEYAECLCLALTCSLEGRRAIAKLTGVLATLNCKDQGVTDRCTWLRDHVVEEILAGCRRKSREGEGRAQTGA